MELLGSVIISNEYGDIEVLEVIHKHIDDRRDFLSDEMMYGASLFEHLPKDTDKILLFDVYVTGLPVADEDDVSYYISLENETDITSVYGRMTSVKLPPSNKDKIDIYSKDHGSVLRIEHNHDEELITVESGHSCVYNFNGKIHPALITFVIMLLSLSDKSTLEGLANLLLKDFPPEYFTYYKSLKDYRQCTNLDLY